ncbi:MAG: SAM-dependent methyltransferase [Hyphomicrobium sp. 32-62-53]|nr:MAG: SAM-dependent methyltransferase [Hyphomicrobium sp. 32-62-53]
MSTLPAGTDLFPGTTEKQWHELLVRSIREPVISGIDMPRFPHGRVQRGFVGSADEQTLAEANNFWLHVKKACVKAGNPVTANTRFLDFGSAWGRYTRFFWRDIPAKNLFGVDIDPEIVATCRYLGVPGHFSVIEPLGQLPYADNSFDLIIAYSVFTHLPENVANHWMKELSRVAAPGAVIAFTVEPRRFLTFIETLDPASPNMWHALMATFKDRVPGLLAQFDKGEYAYIPTSGGAYRDADVYGDAAISERYIQERWSSLFRLVDYHDVEAEFWQAIVTAQKP